MKNNKFEIFEDNDTNCDYVTIGWNSNLEDTIKKLNKIYSKIKSNVEVKLSLDDIHIAHPEQFDSVNSCEESFLGYDGQNYYVQIYLFPEENKCPLEDLALISFFVKKEQIQEGINFFEMDYLAAIG